DAPPAAAPPLPEEVVAGGLPVQDLPGPRDPEALGRSSMRLLFHAYPCALMCRRRLLLLRGRLLLDGRDHHHHVAPVELRALVYGSNSLEVPDEPVQDLPSELCMRHLPSPEHDGHLDPGPLLQEPLHVPLLGGVVVGLDLRPEL